MKLTKTERGFQRIDFNDLYGTECSLQQSSLAVYQQPGTGAIWLGPNNNRMHLNEEQVLTLCNQLRAWLYTGEFLPPEQAQR